MSGNDAFEEEMGFPSLIRDEHAERILAGGAPQSGGDIEEVGAFISAVTVAVPTDPDPRVEAAVVHELAETARSASIQTARAPTAELPGGAVRRGAWRPRLALAAKVAVAVALVPAAMAGLAFAGVTLPEPAREAMERIGLDLPNQSAVDEPTADDDGDDEASSHAHEGSAAAGEPNRRANGESASRGRSDGPRSDGPRRVARGHDRGKGEPQLGAPAPITPPGQGEVPPAAGGVPPTGGSSSGAQPQATGPPGGVPPGQADK